MNTIFALIQKEKHHFERISRNAQRLVISFFMYGLGVPLITTFTNAFIWSNSHNFASVIVYNIGSWVTLPIMYFTNGVLLQFIPAPLLYTFGLILTASAPVIVIMFSLKGLISMFLVGIIFGMGWGFYWSNRTFYTLRNTEDLNRNYFYSLTFTIDIITGIVVPFIIGWVIVLGGNLSYRILAILLFITYLTAGLTTLKLSMDPSEHAHGIVTKIKGKWNLMRCISFFFGFQSGTNLVLPSLMILYLLGNEGILGTVSSFGALLSAFSIYQIGKIALTHHRIRIFALGVTVLVIATAMLALYPSNLGIVMYVVGTAITANFTWSSYNPMLMRLIDQYTPTKKQNRFKYIVDHEVFLNMGRITGVGIFFLLYSFSSKLLALRFTPVIITSFQVLVLFLLKKIVKQSDYQNNV